MNKPNIEFTEEYLTITDYNSAEFLASEEAIQEYKKFLETGDEELFQEGFKNIKKILATKRDSYKPSL